MKLNGYICTIDNATYFIVNESYYVKDSVIKRVLLKSNKSCDTRAVKAVRSMLKRSVLIVDNRGIKGVKLKGNNLLSIDNLTIIYSNK